MGEMLLTNANIVLDDSLIKGSVVVDHGEIITVDTEISHSESAVDFQGDYLLPGLVELHTDNLERHVLPRNTVKWSSFAAAHAHDAQVISAGITTVFNALSVGDIAELSGRIKYLDDMVDGLADAVASGHLRAEHRLHLRCEISFPMLQERLERIGKHDLVGIVSLMDHTPGQRQFRNMELCYAFYKEKYSYNDEQMRDFVELSVNNLQEYGLRNTDYALSLAQQSGYALCSHDDATSDHVEQAARYAVSIAEFPTTLIAAELSRDAGMSVLMGAPNLILGKSHTGNVSALSLAQKNCLDVLSSDYLPHSLLQAVFLLPTLSDDYTLSKAVRTATKTPADSVGLTDRGEIAVGKRADIIRVNATGPVPVVKSAWRQGRQVLM